VVFREKGFEGAVPSVSPTHIEKGKPNWDLRALPFFVVFREKGV
jgi:hypothetical protein